VGAIPGLPAAEVALNAPDVRQNVIHGFQNYAVSAFYIAAMILLCMHLYHGAWSMFQSLGFSHPRYTPVVKKGAAVAAILIAIGNCSIPIAVLAGLLK
jgi:succinate dehydrogenase / fumarate reductase cytochrome b subunit